MMLREGAVSNPAWQMYFFVEHKINAMGIFVPIRFEQQDLSFKFCYVAR